MDEKASTPVNTKIVGKWRIIIMITPKKIPGFNHPQIRRALLAVHRAGMTRVKTYDADIQL